MSWDQAWNELDTKLDTFQIQQNRIIQPNRVNEPSPWLERARWAEYLGGYDREILLGLIGKPDTPLLSLVWTIFDGLASKIQQILAHTGIFARFEIVRTEKDQSRAKPFRAYQDSTKILVYGKPWKQILSFFVRTQLNPDENSYPSYFLTEDQMNTFQIFIELVQKRLDNPDLDENLSNSDADSTSSHARPIPESQDDSIPDDIDTTTIFQPRSNQIQRLDQLERACLDFCLSLLDQQAKIDEYELPFVNVLAVLGLDPKGFKGVDAYPSILSSILKISRFFILRYVWDESDHSDLSARPFSVPTRPDSEASTLAFGRKLPNLEGLDLLAQLKRLVDRILIRGSFTPINWLLDLRGYGMNLAFNTTSRGSIDWVNTNTLVFGPISFQITEFRSFLHGLVQSTRAILLEEVLFSDASTVPAIPWPQIFDNPLDSTPFSNFLRDSRTKLGLDRPNEWLFRRIADNPILASRFRIGSEWNTAEINIWIASIRLFLGKLLVLFHITGGQPARAPELLSIQYSNSTSTGLRNIFVENGLVSFVTYYHKGYSVQNSTKIIHRYLPREVGELFVYYIWLVQPFQARISLAAYRKPLSEYLFENPTRNPAPRSVNFTSDQFRKVFRTATERGLGLAINPSQYRHIAIGITRRYLRKDLFFQPDEGLDESINDDDYSDDILDLQAAHSTRIAGAVYARGLFDQSGEVLSIKQRFREASIVGFFSYLFSSIFFFSIYLLFFYRVRVKVRLRVMVRIRVAFV